MKSALPVTVVIPCFRCTATINRAVSSVVAQTRRPAEMILVDDASGDETLEHLQALQQKLGDWVQVIPLAENGGAACARNAGWDRASQAYVAFLDADDAWHPRKLELQHEFMSRHPEVMLCSHLHRVIPTGNLQTPQWPLPERVTASLVTWNALLLRHQFVTPSVMLRCDLPLRFSVALRHMEDYQLWLEVAGAPYTIAKLQVELAAIYKPPYGAAGLSAELWRMEQAELAVLRHIQQSGKISAAACLALMLYSLLKYLRRRLIVALR